MESIGKVGTMQIPAIGVQDNLVKKSTPAEAQTSFATSLKDAINTMNAYQVESDAKTQALASGEINNLHDVMITAQKASIALQTGVEIQRKAIDAYNEIIRMQV